MLLLWLSTVNSYGVSSEQLVAAHFLIRVGMLHLYRCALLLVQLDVLRLIEHMDGVHKPSRL